MRPPSHRIVPALTAAAVIALPTPLAGQDLNTLPVGSRTIAVGAERQGVLSSLDFPMPDGSFAQAWAMTATGAEVTIDLISDVFDAYLLLVGPGIVTPVSDDDGAGGCNARITHTLADSGTYRVIVNSISAGAVGEFVLRASESPPPASGAECTGMAPTTPAAPALDTTRVRALPRAGSFGVGDSITATLGPSDPTLPDGRRVQIWELRGTPGTSVTIDQLSFDFDAYLSVLHPGSATTLIDDDGAGYCDARLAFEFRSDEPVLVMAGSIGDGGGDFSLRARTDPPLPADAGCSPPRVAADVLAALPVAGALTVGASLGGMLTEADPLLPNETRARAYTLAGDEGDEVTIDLVSDDFDAFLHVIGPGLRHPLADDDGGGRCHARLTLTLPASGEYRVVVNTFSAATGAFALRVEREPRPPAEGSCGEENRENVFAMLEALPSAGRLTAESEGNGSLTETDASVMGDGPFAHAWDYEGRAGESVTIDVMSDGFDAFVIVTGPGLGLDALDDDCGDGTNARLAVTFPEAATYRVVVTTFNPGETGPYMIFVTPGADPATVRCGASSPEADDLLAALDAVPVAATLEVGSVIDGTLDAMSGTDVEGSFVVIYEMAGAASETVYIDLVAAEFDAILIVTGPGIDGLESDDDGAGACNARLALTFSETGVYRIAASSVTPGETGAYQLRVTSEPGPIDPAGCSG